MKHTGQKVHAVLAEAVFDALRDIFASDKHAGAVIEKTLHSHKKWGARDRRFVAENVYDITRWWRLYWAILDQKPCFTDQALWMLLGLNLYKTHKELPQNPECDLLEIDVIEKRKSELQHIRAVRESVPDWLDQLCAEQLGTVWERELSALNKPAPVVLRVNTLRTTRPECAALLKNVNIATKEIAGLDDALMLTERQSLQSVTQLERGSYEMQDVSSQMVSVFLDPKPGTRVIDACAGGGGKALHIAALMQNKGKIIAMDIAQWKLDNLKKRARFAGADIIESRLIESTKAVKRQYDTADILLLDVPCTGLGVLRRNPDTKWKLSAESIDRVCALQAEILDTYSKMVKRGGNNSLFDVQYSAA